MPHLALLGDSIFDNGAYVKDGPEVCTLLQRRVPSDWTVTLCAVDGSTARDVPTQLDRISATVTHLVLSVGGNDALMHEHLLNARVASCSEALLLLATALDEFERSYRDTMLRVLALGRKVTVCTIYNANFAEARQARCIRIAVALFNDVILRVAGEHALKTIDLRYVCTESADYANDIEPSVIGGEKIAAAITTSFGIGERGASAPVVPSEA